MNAEKESFKEFIKESLVCSGRDTPMNAAIQPFFDKWWEHRKTRKGFIVRAKGMSHEAFILGVYTGEGIHSLAGETRT